MDGTIKKSKERGDSSPARPGRARALDEGITILLVDPRAWTREALARSLEKASRDLRVLRFAEVTELAQGDAHDRKAIVLINGAEPRVENGAIAAAITAIQSRLPGVPIVAVSESSNVEAVRAGLDRGLSGYIPFSLDLMTMVNALRFVAAGGTFIPAEAFMADMPSVAVPPGAQDAVAAMAPRGDVDALTPREISVLDLLKQGKSNKLIARELNMSEATVKVHVRHIMRKVGASNRTQVALLATFSRVS